MRKKILNYVILLAIILLSLKVLFSSIDPLALEETIRLADGRFLLLGIVCMFVYWGLEAGMIDRKSTRLNSSH